MKITVEQSGGYVGLTKFQVDINDLSSDLKKQLQSLVERSNVSNLVSRETLPASNTPASKVTIETEKGTQQVRFDIQNKPEGIGPLLKFIQQHGRPVSPSELPGV